MRDGDSKVGLLQIGRELCNPILKRTAAARARAISPHSRNQGGWTAELTTGNPLSEWGLGSRRHAGMDEVFSSQQDSCKLGKVAGRDETGWGRLGNTANLDFEARVPVPFSVFPSSYRESETATQTHIHEEVEIKLPQLAGREGQHSSPPAQAHLPPAEEGRFREEEVRITREEETHRRPGIREEFVVREEYRRPQSTYTESRYESDNRRRPQESHSVIDVAESEYRSRVQPNYYKEASTVGSTVDSSYSGHHHKASTIVDDYTVDTPSPPRLTYHKHVDVVEETVDTPRHTPKPKKSSKMGYYDSEGHYHSIRHGLHKLADRITHHREDVDVYEARESRGSRVGSSEGPAQSANTVTIPSHHVRLGDILILQGRPCQIIRISTSAATGQHRYLGVDLFTKQLHEESSFVSNPAPSVVVQTMLGPVFKQYRVLDLHDGTITAMTETGDVKQNLPVIDQSNLWEKLNKAFQSGRGSVRVQVVSDNGRELVVDMKVVHGSRL
ncbi:uncharacterized protein C8A04DRAFT_26497 [Dichotomopilus funicola]|uniref:Translation initiation factor 5A C-terminal domain-containing protein n=1 Tax=Dichotomopilus funicola TaxID=1934379 RepID=A0AAN6V6N9_9PEZI|nr:hypothetical protein C8A04DRAFT_26497 [Dichotomopilus funicola]